MAGNYINLSMAVRGMKFGKLKVVEAFNKYVPLKDFDKDEKDALLIELWKANADHESNSIETPISPLFIATEKSANSQG